MTTNIPNGLNISNDGTLTISINNPKITEYIEENLRYAKNIKYVEVKVSMERLVLTYLSNVNEIDFFDNTIENLYTNGNQNLVNLNRKNYPRILSRK